MPKVSVIIPVYGVGKYIERCARSLFEQTMDDIEYVFVDDCSPDHSISVLKSIMEEYPSRKNQVSILRHDTNRGIPAARKTGLSHATGDYIIYCDSDDWVDVTMYEKMWRKAVSGNYDMVICGYRETDENGETLLFENFKNIHEKESNRLLIADKIPNYLWNKLIKRDLFHLIDEWPADDMHEDYAISAPIACQCHSIGFVYEPLYNYFINRNSISNSAVTFDKLMQSKRNAELAISYIEKHGGGIKYRNEIRHRKCLVKIDSFNLPWWEYMRLYPSANLYILLDPCLSGKEKLGHISKCLGVRYIIRRVNL